MTNVVAPVAGRIVDLLVEVGAEVEEGDELAVIEALKMENTIYARCNGRVTGIQVKKGDRVEDDTLLLVIE